VLLPISGQASVEKVEAKLLVKLFNYKNRLVAKTRAAAKKCPQGASWLYTQQPAFRSCPPQNVGQK
jgi:hypothetical protein